MILMKINIIFLYIKKKYKDIMKRFKDFMNENLDNNYQDFLDDVKNTIISDFDLSQQQVDVFINKNDEQLKQLFDDGIEPIEAIGIIKLY